MRRILGLGINQPSFGCSIVAPQRLRKQTTRMLLFGTYVFISYTSLYRCLGTIGREHRPSHTRVGCPIIMLCAPFVAKWFIPILMAMAMSASEQQPIITSAITFRLKLDLVLKAASGRPGTMMNFTRMYSGHRCVFVGMNCRGLEGKYLTCSVTVHHQGTPRLRLLGPISGAQHSALGLRTPQLKMGGVQLETPSPIGSGSGVTGGMPLPDTL